MSQWTPKQDGPDFDFPQIIAPLKPFQKQLTIISGMENKSAIAAPVHAITPGTWLSCVPPRISHDPYGGITIDQIVAKHIGQDTPLPSLEVGTEERGGEGSCDRNYGCSYGKTISFRDPSTPLPMEHNPRKLFQQLFGAGDTADERVQLARESRSILDLVSREAGRHASQPRPARPGRARRLPVDRARDRAPRTATGKPRHVEGAAAGCAGRHPVQVR